MHLISSAFPDICIVPALPEHAAALAVLVRENREHLQTYLPAVLQLAAVAEAGAYLQAAAVQPQAATSWSGIFFPARPCAAASV